MNFMDDNGEQLPPGLGYFRNRLLARANAFHPPLQTEERSYKSWTDTPQSDMSTNCTMTNTSSRFSKHVQQVSTDSFSDAKEEEQTSTKDKAPEILKVISEIGLSGIGLLNEVCSKVKKRVDYIVKNSPQKNVKLFEYECVYDKVTIGVGKGSSKQAAKNEAALAGVKFLLEKKDLEKAYITLSVEKLRGIGPVKPEVVVLSPVQSIETVDGSLMNGSAIYELNLIAKELFIEPRWKLSSAAGPNGQYQVELLFDKLMALGKGRKKDDAKRDAAMQVIQKIRSSKELSEKYNPKAKKRSSNQNNMTDVDVARQDRAKSFFTSCLNPKFADTQTSSLRWMDSITEPNRNFDDYLSDLVLQYKLDDDMEDLLQGFFKVISDHTDIITSNPKQVLLDAPKHLADYATNCYLVPTGSFAFDCMRRDKLVINAMLVYEESKRITEKDFLNLYLYSLQEYQNLLIKESQLSFKIDVEIGSSEIGEHLVITAKSIVGKLTMQIQLHNSSQTDAVGGCEPSIGHIKRIYDCFEDSYKLKQYREVMGLMRLWKEKNKLMLVPTEVLDVVLLDSFLNNKASSTAGHVMNFMTVMSTDETLKPLLAKYGASYTTLYKDIPSRVKLVISSKCTESLKAIYSQDFKESGFY